MKNILIGFVLCFITFSCSVKKNQRDNFELKNYRNTSFYIFNIKDSIPNDAVYIKEMSNPLAKTRINCSMENVFSNLKKRVLKAKGNAFKITSHRPSILPNGSCHRIKGVVLKVKNLERVNLNKEKKIKKTTASLNIYRFYGGYLTKNKVYLNDSLICVLKSNYKKTITISKEGMYKISINKSKPLILDVKIGENYYIKEIYTPTFWRVGEVFLKVISPKLGEFEFESF